MPALQYSVISQGDQSVITVLIPGDDRSPFVAQSDHPNFKEIVAAVVGGDASADEVADLFDVSQVIAQRFERLSERVTVAGGRVYFDGDEVHGSIVGQILRFKDEGVEDWKPLVAFMEKVAQNPNPHSREQLYDWLKRHAFAITKDGDLVGYKGVAKDAEGNLVSVSKGPAIVDGQSVNGAVPNYIGAVVEMPRGMVHHDPSQGCSTGLHVATFDYAKGWAQGALLTVHVNPRDVVSVPTDCDWAKVRVCRYVVVETTDVEYTGPVLPDGDDEDDEFYSDDYCCDECSCDEDETPEAVDCLGEALKVGDRIVDIDGDAGTIVEIMDDGVLRLDLDAYGAHFEDARDCTKIDD